MNFQGRVTLGRAALTLTVMNAVLTVMNAVLCFAMQTKGKPSVSTVCTIEKHLSTAHIQDWRNIVSEI